MYPANSVSESCVMCVCCTVIVLRRSQRVRLVMRSQRGDCGMKVSDWSNSPLTKHTHCCECDHSTRVVFDGETGDMSMNFEVWH